MKLFTTLASLLLTLSLIGCKSESSAPQGGDGAPSTSAAASTPTEAPAGSPAATAEQTVEVACATCIYRMSGVQGCKLAAKIDGKPILVRGGSVDAHNAGLCSAAKQAVVSGQVEGDTFVATKVELAK
jgi:hypothetical protein